jgi:hypothetical protein
MNTEGSLFSGARLLGLLALLAGAGKSPATALDTNLIASLIGRPGAWNAAERVFKITAPRADVKVAVDGWAMPPFMGLTSWAAFTPGRRQPCMVMGDLVLFQDEVNPVMSVAFANGLDVTALHNHFFHDEPRVYFLHIAGEGEVAHLARAVRRALDRVQEIRAANPQPAARFSGAAIAATNAITARPIEDILGLKGQAREGMLKFTLGRATAMPCGCAVAAEMGVNTWAAFGGTDSNAVVCGDFAVTEDELRMVLRALRHFDINIVAIHHHLAGERPRLLFVHYWGRGRAAALAQGLKTALAAQNDKR